MKFAAHLPLLRKAAIGLAIFLAGYYFPFFGLFGGAPVDVGGATSAAPASVPLPGR